MLQMQAVVLVDKQIFAIQQVINLIACIGAAIFLSITVQRTMGS
jgi:hypothetical protein